MQVKKRTIHLIISAMFLFLLILRADIAAEGAQEGLKLCISVIIPSLFPFFFITSYLIPLLADVRFPGIRKLCKMLDIPEGCEGLLILGFVGGYPVGAQAISSAFQTGKLNLQQASRLLGFCSNAGPAFIFGVTQALFPSRIIPWILWLIHILSACFTAKILPKIDNVSAVKVDFAEFTLIQAFRHSLSITASVCGWIILFKVLLRMLFTAVHLQESILTVIISGIFELSGGCIALNAVSNDSLRFILCSALLSFGGLCVLMQTASVTSRLGFGLYLPGKIMQTMVSISLSTFFVLIYDKNAVSALHAICIFLAASIGVFLLRRICRKKMWKLCNP